MDAFAIAVGFAGISPAYFYDSLDMAEFEAIGQAYREDWEKARLPVLALGGEFKLPWDNLNKPAPKPAPKYTPTQRANVASKLAEIMNSRN